jgi:hypothetical protein
MLSIFGRAALVLSFLCAADICAWGEEPDLMQTLVAQDATLNDNLTPIEPRWARNAQGRTLALGFGVEKTLSSSLGVEIGGQWDSLSPRDGPAAAAFGNIDLALKYVFLKTENFQFVAAPQLSFPTSSHILDEPMNVQAGGYLSWGGRFATDELPGYLRAIEFQGDLGYSHSFASPASDEVFLDPVVDYSMPYLDYSTRMRNVWPLRNLCPFTEINFDKVLDGNGQRGVSIFATPGIAYIAKMFQLSVGIQVPLSNAAQENAQIAVMGSIIISVDPLY